MLKKTDVLQVVQALLQENYNQRITNTLANGFLVLLAQALPDDEIASEKVAEPTETVP